VFVKPVAVRALFSVNFRSSSKTMVTSVEQEKRGRGGASAPAGAA
jgi:hypothetical protein